jgi:arylsulfatase A-like enzyme
MNRRRFLKKMARKGYQTALFGKWHLVTDPTNEEFGHWEVLTGAGGQGNYYNPAFNTCCLIFLVGIL